jgi:predicted house-cleaning noncanonical NTP pyrophosphatase (MazG superfamily)
MPSEQNKFSYRFSIARAADGHWEITDHDRNEVEELISDEEIWLADRLEVIEETAAANHREVMRLKKIMREHGLLDEALTQPLT